MSGTSPVCAVVGVGDGGLGEAIATKFAAQGFAVAILARTEATLATVLARVDAAGTAQCMAQACDVTDEASVQAAFAAVASTLGAPDVLVYNAGSFVRGSALEISTDAFVGGLNVNCVGAFHAARRVLPAMVEKGSGTVLLTGATASIKGSAMFSGFACGKFALRALSQSLAREFGPKGVHVAHVIVDGLIDTKRVRQWFPDKSAEARGTDWLAPSAIAETYWHLHSQHRSCWSSELDIRPAVEKW